MIKLETPGTLGALKFRDLFARFMQQVNSAGKRQDVASFIVPYAPADMHHHAPNERMPLDDLRRGARTTAALCTTLAQIG